MGLLKGIDPLLTADLLHVLRSMGHGDRLCIVDCNFPAAQVARHTSTGKHIILTVSLPEALSAICSVLPLDFFEDIQAYHMAPQEGLALDRKGKEVTEALKECIMEHAGPDAKVCPMERFTFYDESRTCFAVVQTLERRPYGNVIVTKGCVGADGKDLRKAFLQNLD